MEQKESFWAWEGKILLVTVVFVFSVLGILYKEGMHEKGKKSVVYSDEVIIGFQ